MWNSKNCYRKPFGIWLEGDTIIFYSWSYNQCAIIYEEFKTKMFKKPSSYSKIFLLGYIWLYLVILKQGINQAKGMEIIHLWNFWELDSWFSRKILLLQISFWCFTWTKIYFINMLFLPTFVMAVWDKKISSFFLVFTWQVFPCFSLVEKILAREKGGNVEESVILIQLFTLVLPTISPGI